MARVIRVHLEPAELAVLERVARRCSRSPEATAGLLLGEKLREEAFPGIEFRHSAAGRQAFVKGTGAAVWEVVMVARDLGMDTGRVAQHFGWPEVIVQAALAYARAHSDEIDAILDRVESFTFEDLRRILPEAQEIQM